MDGYAERRAALDMIHRHSPGSTRRPTLAADKGCNCAEFVKHLRRAYVTPHVAQKVRYAAIDGRTTWHPGYAVSQNRRKKIEEPFGWADGPDHAATHQTCGRPDHPDDGRQRPRPTAMIPGRMRSRGKTRRRSGGP